MKEERVKISVCYEGETSEFEIRRTGLRVLRGLEKWGILSLPQIEGLAFNGGSEKEKLDLFFNGSFEDEYRGASYKVLERLEKRGLAKHHRHINAPRVYALTREGHKALEEAGMARIGDYREMISDFMVKHELLVSGIGLVMSELLGLRVSTEFERQVLSRGHAGDFPLPDLWITDAEQPKAVEVERSLKSAARYRKLWEFYRANLPGPAVVLYIAAFPNGTKLLLSRARKFMADFIYVCDLMEFKSSLGRGPFVGYRGDEIYLGKPEQSLLEPLFRPEESLVGVRPY